MASAAGSIKRLSDLTFEGYERWSRSVKDYVTLTTRQHMQQDGTVKAIRVTDEHLAAAMRQSLEGPVEKVLSSMAAADLDKPVNIEQAVAAACLPNEQAELSLVLDEMIGFNQSRDEPEMEYLMRFDKLQTKVHKLLRETDGHGHIVNVILPDKWWGFVLKKGLQGELERAVVGSLGTLATVDIRKCVIGMAEPSALRAPPPPPPLAPTATLRR